jgi:hypothetical protein
MELSLEGDLTQLERLAFRRRKKTGKLLQTIHRAMRRPSSEGELACLDIVRRWLLVPFTLWPVDFQGLGEHLIELRRKRRPIPAEVQFVMEQANEIPSVDEQTAVLEYEHLVESGSYERWIKAQEKFIAEEQRLLRNRKFKREWLDLKKLFDVGNYRDKKGIVRRSMVQERNFRRDWDFLPKDRARLFQVAFDAFCHRWKLYGMEKDKPLLLKLTVNLTAHGTMIVVPAFWSFDYQRDLHWKAIMALHKARGVERQGPKVSPLKIEADEFYLKAARLWEDSKIKSLRGEGRRQWVLQRLNGNDRADASTLRRWVQRGKALS